MATYACCTGQTECNHIITIGYLKSFIGTDIKDTGGTTVYVNTTQPDSYVPTYSELTSGTLIPQFADGGNGRWHSNIDGITVKGTYASNQNVKQEDLVLTYTRFNSLSVSAGKTSFSECSGDSTSVCATYTLTKTIKQMNSSCTVTSSTENGSDTTCKMSFSTSCNWLTASSCSNNCITVSANKNGSWTSNTRSCSVTASVTYKGENHSDSVTITQSGLTGGYYERNYKDTTYTDVMITSYSPTVYGCEGASDFSVTATAYYVKRYKWEDSCGTVYDQEPYSSVTGSESAGEAHGSFNKIECPIETFNSSSSLTVTYKGITSDPIVFTQDCVQSCDDCKNITSCTNHCSASGTVGMCGGDVTLSCTQICDVSVYDWVDGICTYISATTEPKTISTVVTIPANETSSPTAYTGTKNSIDYTITQPAGPCHGCTGETATTIWEEYEVSCAQVGDGKDSLQIEVPYVIEKRYGNCPTEIENYTSAITLYNLVCNSGDTKVLRASNPRITQEGDCDCSCKNPTATTVLHNVISGAIACDTSKLVQIPYEIVTEYDNCPPESSDTFYTSYTAVFDENNTSASTSYTFNVSGITVTIEQEAGPCRCLNPVITYTPQNASGTAEPCETSKIIQVPYTTVISYDNCDPEPGEPGTVSFTMTFGQNNTSLERTITSGTSGITVTVVQKPGPCSCLNPTTSATFYDASGTAEACDTSKVVQVPYQIITAYTNCPSITSDTYYTAYTATFNENNTSASTSYTFNVSGATVTIKQKPGPCRCLNPTTSTTLHDASGTAEACDTSKIVQIPYEIVSAYTNCPPDVSDTYYTAYTATFSENNTSASTSYTFNVSGITVTIEQEAGPCRCTGETSAYTWYSVTSSATKCEDVKVVEVPWTCTLNYGNCDPQPGPSGTTLYTMTFGQNNTSSARTITSADTSVIGNATVTIEQEAGPCNCLNGHTYVVWDNTQTIPCDSASTVSVVVPYSSVTEYDNCPSIVTPGTEQFTFYDVECNDGSSRVIRAADPVITQLGGCTCKTCDCSDFSADTRDVVFSYVGQGESAETTIAYSDEPCLVVTASASSTDYRATVNEPVVNNGIVTVSMTNNYYYSLPQRDTKIGTITIMATKDGIRCEDKVIDAYIEGRCRDLTIDVDDMTCSGGTTVITITE